MNQADETQAKRRFMLLNLARLGGLALVLLGIAIASGTIALPAPVGWVLAIIGTAEFFFLPPMLAKNWRSGDR